VKGEVAKNYDYKLQQLKRELRSTISEKEFKEVEEMLEKYNSENYFKLLLDSGKIRILDLPEISIDQILKRIEERKKPFGSKDNGFKDYLIWETVLKEAKIDDILFVSNNTRDFCENNTASDLHEDLLGDLKKQA